MADLEIDVHTLQDLLSRNEITILDVRTDEEYKVDHLRDLHIPLHELMHSLDDLDKSKTYACLCRSGARSMQATYILTQSGFKAYNVQGGVKAWQAQIDPSFKVA